MTDDPAQNEFDALVQKVKRISIQPFTPGQKAGILWADAELKRLREENGGLKGQVCHLNEKLKMACKWLVSAEALSTQGMEQAFHDINTVAPCPHAKMSELAKNGEGKDG